MSNYVATYRRLDDNAARAETQADEYRKRADHDRWEQCRIVHEAVESGEYNRTTFAKAVGKSADTIKVQYQAWARFGDAHPRPTYRDAYFDVKPSANATQVDRATSAVRNLPVEEQEKVAAELPPSVIARQASRPDVARAIARNDDTREAVEEAAIDHRARFQDRERDERMERVPRQAAAGMARAMRTDLATASLRQAAGLIAEAVFEREEFGIQHPDDERDALDRVHRSLTAYEAGTISDDERGWLESIGVQA